MTYTPKMITYTANYTDTIFVVPRAVKNWHKLLGMTWSQLEREGRLIIGKNPRKQSLTKNNLGEEQYSRLISHLRK